MKSPTQPSPFLWGTATSSHQIEGDNRHNDWWAWELAGNCEGGARSGAATDHWRRFKEDLALAADLGLTSYRFSIEWSRLEPEEGRWDPEPLDWYRELVAECERRGLVPMATLHHFTIPQWLAAHGGFSWDGSPPRFAEYVRRVARALGSRVPLWCTLNEPMVLVVGGYLGKFMPPAVFAPTLAAQACANLLRAHVAAYDILRAEIPGAQVGFAHNMIDFRPDRAWHPLERAACWAFDRFYNRSWLDAVTGRKPAFSVPGLIPAAAPVPEARGRRTVDFIGVNYYTKAYLQWRPRDAALTLKEAPLGVSFARRAEETTDMGWAIHPEGLKRILRRVGRYGLPIHVTENGIADREDRLRPRYLREHLLQVADAIADGVDIRGYYYWSLLDNFEWIKGFGPRFGLFSVDYSTFERTATGSARLLRDLIAAHRGGAPKRARIAAVGV